MSKELIKADYRGIEIAFSGDGWFNATQAAERFGKRVNDWLSLDSTKEYITILLEIFTYQDSWYVKTSRARTDRGGGTWFHPDLAIPFARWLDVRFSIWCDRQIRAILSGTHIHYDWKKLRHEAASSFKVMNEALMLVRQEQGKISESHHYSNEARLINRVVSGKFGPMDREVLSIREMDLLAKLEVKNAVLISRSVEYEDRKKILVQYALDLRPVELLEDPHENNRI